MDEVDGRCVTGPWSQSISEGATSPSMNTSGLCTAVIPLMDWLDSEVVPGLELGREVRPIVCADFWPTETFDELGLLALCVLKV